MEKYTRSYSICGKISYKKTWLTFFTSQSTNAARKFSLFFKTVLQLNPAWKDSRASISNRSWSSWAGEPHTFFFLLLLTHVRWEGKKQEQCAATISSCACFFFFMFHFFFFAWFLHTNKRVFNRVWYFFGCDLLVGNEKNKRGRREEEQKKRERERERERDFFVYSISLCGLFVHVAIYIIMVICLLSASPLPYPLPLPKKNYKVKTWIKHTSTKRTRREKRGEREEREGW